MAAKMKLLAAVEEEDELMLFSILSEKENVNYNGRLNIEELTNYQCKNLFRFEKEDLNRLRIALRIPGKIVCRNGTVATGLEGLCILLRRLAYPNRLEDLTLLFGRPVDQLSYILNEVIDLVYDEHSIKLRSLHQEWLSNDCLNNYSDAIHAKGSPLRNCWGFIDGTIRPMCRPNKNQGIVFSGHKRLHALKFQSVVAPNGMIANLYGPVEGKRHDSGMLRASGLLDELEQQMTYPDGSLHSLYGDPAYPLRPNLIAPFRGANLSPEEREFNKRMSSLRVCVEWTFGKILTLFAFLDFKKNLKLYLQPVAKYYLVAGILTNCHTCLYGSETGAFFGLEPPTLEAYLQ